MGLGLLLLLRQALLRIWIGLLLQFYLYFLLIWIGLVVGRLECIPVHLVLLLLLEVGAEALVLLLLLEVGSVEVHYLIFGLPEAVLDLVLLLLLPLDLLLQVLLLLSSQALVPHRFTASITRVSASVLQAWPTATRTSDCGTLANATPRTVSPFPSSHLTS